LARAYTKDAINTLQGLMKSADKDAVRAYCANSLIDRGWGKPHQTVNAELGGEIEITIRKMLGNGKDKT
jgi:hypothetical protein